MRTISRLASPHVVFSEVCSYFSLGKVPPVLDKKDIQAVVGAGETYTAEEIARMSDEEKAIFQEETQKDYSRGPYATEEDLTAGSFGDPALESTRRGLMYDMDEKQQKQFQTI